MARAARQPEDLPVPVERCELCSEPLAARHDHVVDLDRRRLCCACRACALLFEKPGAAEGRYRTVPDRVFRVDGPAVSAAAWAALRIPVSLAFVFFNSVLQRWIAVYPSPAGAVESEPDASALEAVRARTPLFDLALPDVEAVLVRGRRGASTVEALLTPVSAGYELVAEVRQCWRGFDGGDRAWAAIDAFFAYLVARARSVRPAAGGAS